MSNIYSALAQPHNLFSYRPMPFYKDVKEITSSFTQKLDLNLYCIKRPHQTCFIQVTNPHLLTWGIEVGDMLVVEETNELAMGDIAVLEQESQFHLYEITINSNREFLFFPLDSIMKSFKTQDIHQLPIVGVVTNTIHQIKPRNIMKLAA